MTAKNTKLDKTLQTIQDDVRRYTGRLIPRLLSTYGIPVVVALLVASIIAPLLAGVIPNSTANILALAANIFILVYGVRWLDSRTHATGLFILYTRYSQQRRQIKTLRKNDETPDPAMIDNLREEANAFISAMQERNIDPFETSQ